MRKILYCSFCLLTIFYFSGIAFSQVTPQRRKHVSIQLEPNYSFEKYQEASSNLESTDSIKSNAQNGTTSYNIFELSHKDKWGGNLGFDVSASVLTQNFRITVGYSFLMAITNRKHTVLDLGYKSEGDYINMKQDFSIGGRIPFKFGYRFKFDSFEFSPYAGANGGVYLNNFVIDQTNVLSETIDDATLEIMQFVVAPSCGLQFLFNSESKLGFHIGIELGYNIVQGYDDVKYDWKDNTGLSSGKVTRELVRHTLPVSEGLYIKTGIGFNINI